MKSIGIIAVVFLAGAMFAPLARAGAPLTVVELFQSQGCSSCPPANANVLALADRPDLLALSFGVTYWDHLGWKDTFASPQFTARQWDYAHAFRRDEVFTPEVVVNGRADVVGTNREELEGLIRREAKATEPAVRIEGDRVSIGAGARTNAQVWLVRYDPNIVEVPIGAGENEGRTLPHKNVVKELLKLGEWRGMAANYRLPSRTNSTWRDAVLVQNGPGGPILAAARN